jgi:hypothetical protein
MKLTSAQSVEPVAEVSHATNQAARIVSLASWTDENCTRLARHEPKPTDKLVELGSMH